jgi:hypothetical protein
VPSPAPRENRRINRRSANRREDLIAAHEIRQQQPGDQRKAGHASWTVIGSGVGNGAGGGEGKGTSDGCGMGDGGVGMGGIHSGDGGGAGISMFMCVGFISPFFAQPRPASVCWHTRERHPGWVIRVDSHCADPQKLARVQRVRAAVSSSRFAMRTISLARSSGDSTKSMKPVSMALSGMSVWMAGLGSGRVASSVQFRHGARQTLWASELTRPPNPGHGAFFGTWHRRRFAIAQTTGLVANKLDRHSGRALTPVGLGARDLIV